MIKVMRKSIILSVVLLLLSTFTAVAQGRVYQLSSHILDINTGRPAPGVKIVLSLISATLLSSHDTTVFLRFS